MQTTKVLTKVAQYRAGEAILCKHHGLHSEWKCYANNVVCQHCMRDRAMRYQRKHYLKYLALWARRRDPKSEVTEQFLHSLMVAQCGRCALTEVPFDEGHRPSVDRKDSAVGYTQDNVQLVLFEINRMKSDLPQNHFLALCALVAENNHGRHE